MGRKRKHLGGRVISVRVADNEMSTLRELMEITGLNASALMREALRLYVASTS